MSQENVELVRKTMEAFSAGDQDSVFDLATTDFTFDVSRTDLEGGVHTGRAAILEFLSNWVSTWEDHTVEPVEFIDAGGDHVVVVLHEQGRIKGIDTWVEHVRGVVYTVCDGKVARYDEYMDRAQALEAVGFSG
ncbi:MAG: SnoaL-like domain [Thermoleophilaceae bacterium]|nr:SnoaL-like domain [Thermoleophilaceae bacterium]